MLSPVDYQAAAMRTAGAALDPAHGLENAALGLLGETGELADAVKKWRHQGHTLDVAALRAECGDVLWYIARLATALNVPLAEAWPVRPWQPLHEAALLLGVYAGRVAQVVYEYSTAPAAALVGHMHHLRALVPRLLKTLASVCAALDSTLQEAAEGNIQKLRRRYPDGFDPARSIERADDLTEGEE